MNVQRMTSSPVETEADALVVGVCQGESPQGAAAEVDQASGGVLSRLLEAEEISAKLGDATPLWSLPGVKAPLVVAVGLGPRERLGRQSAFRGAAAAAKFLAAKKRSRVAMALGADWPADWVESAVAGAAVGCQGQDLRRKEKSLNPFDELLWHGADEGLSSGVALGEAINLTRRVINLGPNEIYPESFADLAGEVAGEVGLEIEVWDEDRLDDERCGSLLAVARASHRPPRLVILKHAGGGESDPTLALVGKGVTFDSGGLSLKPSESMSSMKCDMAGAGTVLGAMRAIAELKLPVNAIGLMGLVENMPGGDAMKLGDVLTARSGTTIEVLNTDAEGRLVLADVLDVARERGAAKIVDLATLTGACVVALGEDVAGLMANDDVWRQAIADCAQACGEEVWPLPMYELFDEQIKSEVADIKNIGAGRWGGAITAAKFLEQFVGDTPWVHIDIAGPAFRDKPKPWIDAGASGALVRTLVEVARRWES